MKKTQNIIKLKIYKLWNKNKITINYHVKETTKLRKHKIIQKI